MLVNMELFVILQVRDDKGTYNPFLTLQKNKPQKYGCSSVSEEKMLWEKSC